MLGEVPMLASVHFMGEIDAYIAFKKGVGYFPTLDPDHFIKLHRFKTGHLGLAIFDDGSRHQKVKVDDASILKGLEIAGHIFEGTEQSSSSSEK